MHIRTFVALTIMLLASCGDGAELDCTPENHCVPGSPATCEPGFEWLDPLANGDFRCVPSDEPQLSNEPPSEPSSPPPSGGGGSTNNPPPPSCGSSEKRCDNTCIDTNADCCNSGQGHYCAGGECRADSSASSGFSCSDPLGDAVFPGIARYPLYEGAYWEFEWYDVTRVNGNVSDSSTGRFRIELGQSRQVNVPAYGGQFTAYRLLKADVSGDSYPWTPSDHWQWVGKIGALVAGAQEQSDGSLRFYRIYDGYEGTVKYGGLLGAYYPGVSSANPRAFRWVSGSTDWFGGEFMEATDGSSTGGCTSAGGTTVCTPLDNAGLRHWVHPDYGYLGQAYHSLTDYSDAVYEGDSQVGLVATNVAAW